MRKISPALFVALFPVVIVACGQKSASSAPSASQAAPQQAAADGKAAPQAPNAAPASPAANGAEAATPAPTPPPVVTRAPKGSVVVRVEVNDRAPGAAQTLTLRVVGTSQQVEGLLRVVYGVDAGGAGKPVAQVEASAQAVANQFASSPITMSQSHWEMPVSRLDFKDGHSEWRPAQSVDVRDLPPLTFP